MTVAPSQITNTELAQRLITLVDRWNTRENQMIALLTQPEGDVIVTDGIGANHTMPSFPQLQSTVAALIDPLTGAVAEAREINSTATAIVSRAQTSATEAADSAAAAAGSANTASAKVDLAASEANRAATEANRSATEATNASTSATTAEAHKTAASTSATNAGTYASNASGSASAASTHAATASQAKVDAQTARDKAALWADAPQGTQVETGRYSAKHWAEQAQAAVTGTVVYMGTWDASTGSFPTSPSKGHFYRVTGAGVIASVDYKPGDQVIYNGTDWDKIDNTDAVTSVAGKSGAVALVAGDIGGLGALATRSDVDWTTHVTGKPATFTPSTHGHQASEITQSATYRFVSDSEKATWNGKQAALGYTPVNKAGDSMTGPITIERDTGLLFVARTTDGKQFSMGNSWSTAGDGVAFLLNQANTDIVFATSGVERGRIKAGGPLSWLNPVISTGTNGGLFFDGRAGAYRQYAWYSPAGTYAALNVSGVGDVVSIDNAGNFACNGVKLGQWATGAYRGLLADNGEYLVMTANALDPNTYVGARTGGTVIIRPNANDTASQVVVDTGGMKIRGGPNITNEGGLLRVEGQVRTYGRYQTLAANGGAWVNQPRVFVGASVDVAQMDEGDLFVQL